MVPESLVVKFEFTVSEFRVESEFIEIEFVSIQFLFKQGRQLFTYGDVIKCKLADTFGAVNDNIFPLAVVKVIAIPK